MRFLHWIARMHSGANDTNCGSPNGCLPTLEAHPSTSVNTIREPRGSSLRRSKLRQVMLCQCSSANSMTRCSRRAREVDRHFWIANIPPTVGTVKTVQNRLFGVPAANLQMPFIHRIQPFAPTLEPMNFRFTLGRPIIRFDLCSPSSICLACSPVSTMSPSKWRPPSSGQSATCRLTGC